MQDDDNFWFTRSFRFINKNDDNLFVVTYEVQSDLKGFQQPEKKASIPIQKKEIRPEPDRKPQQGRKMRQSERQQIEELKKYSRVNMKQYNKQNRDYRNAPKQEKKQIQIDQKQMGGKQKNKGKLKFKDSINDDQLLLMLRNKRSKSSQIREDRGVIEETNPLKRFSKRGVKIYDDYVSLDQIEESREKGDKLYYKGRVEFSEGLKWIGKIKTDEIDGNLVAEGKNRNRCIHEDEVYFIVLKEERQKIQCKIVGIVPTKKKRQIVGRIDFFKSKKIYYITPINKRIITMNVRIDDIRKDWLKDMDKKYFLAEFVHWQANSQYPECKVIDEYGQFGEVEIEARALLKTHDVEDTEYDDEEVRIGLQKFISKIDEKTGEYTIDKEQIAKRTDLRENRVFTIDPLTARDFDDALSITKLPQTAEKKQNYEIGVHIADASFFVEEGSLIDQEAKKRTTSVYLVHRVIPMLPRILCETMCSLNPGLERLTLSIWFQVDQDGNVGQKVRFDRSVIKSKARFTYEQAQLIIQGKIKSQNQVDKGFGCIEEKDFELIAEDIKTMNKLALKLREKRIENGSLIFEVPKKSFTLDEKHFPISFSIKQRCESNFLVEEYMLLANRKVAELLVQNLKGKALLRRHKFPGAKKIQKFQFFMNKIGFPLKFDKNTKIQEQINKILEDPQVMMSIKNTIKYEMISLLQAADYFLVKQSLPETWIHYALSMPVYTHFTSPIRRYPDIIVHRQLIAIIDSLKNKTQIKIDEVVLNECVTRCNKNKLSAKRVSSGCEKIFLCLYLKKNPVNTNAILSSVNDWGFNLCVPSYDFRTIIKFKKLVHLLLSKAGVDASERKFVKMEYKSDQLTFKVMLRELQQVEVRIGSTDSFPIDYTINLLILNPKSQTQALVLVD